MAFLSRRRFVNYTLWHNLGGFVSLTVITERPQISKGTGNLLTIKEHEYICLVICRMFYVQFVRFFKRCNPHEGIAGLFNGQLW